MDKPLSGIPRLSRLPVSTSRSTGSSRAPREQERPGQVAALTVTKRVGGTSNASGPPVPRPLLGSSSRTNETPERERTQDSKSPMGAPLTDQHTNQVEAQDLQGSDVPVKNSIADERESSMSVGTVMHPEDDRGDVAAGTQSAAVRKSCPSLAERTIQTISQIPSSPSPGRRKSSFYEIQSPKRPSPTANQDTRSGSALSRSRAGNPPLNIESPTPKASGRGDSVNGPRGTSLSYRQPMRLQPGSRQQSRVAVGNPIPGKPSSPGMPSKNLRYPLAGGVTNGEAPRDIEKTVSPGNASAGSILSRSPQRLLKQAKTRQLKQVPPSTKNIGSIDELSNGQEKTMRQNIPSRSTGQGSAAASPGGGQKSSAALRESIAKAKAARKQATMKPMPEDDKTALAPLAAVPDVVNPGASLDDVDSGHDMLVGKALSERIETARTSGHLDISAMNVPQIPGEVLNMYKPEAVKTSKVAWYEMVGLTRCSAADNELEVIDSRLFPVVDAQADGDDEDEALFVALESLDLHRNLLRTIPAGLGYLEGLTTLNLVRDTLPVSIDNRDD